MKKIIIIGARGFVGEAVRRSLQSHPEYSILTAGRRPDQDAISFDLNDPASFPRLTHSDCIINCADNFQASPLPLMQYCLEQGLTLVDSTADPQTIETALQRFRQPGRQHRGTVILGAGLFPGLSNILIHDLLQRSPNACDVQLSIFISPFSQAGPSTCRLMAEHFSYRTPVKKAGRDQDLPTLSLGPVVASSLGRFRGLRLYFPEVAMHGDRPFRTLESFVVPMPRFLLPLLAIARPVLSLKALKGLNILGLRILRHGLLKKSPSRIQIHAMVRDADGTQRECLAVTHDGLQSIATGIHVTVEAMFKQKTQGLLMPHEIVASWEQIRIPYLQLSPSDAIRFI